MCLLVFRAYLGALASLAVSVDATIALFWLSDMLAFVSFLRFNRYSFDYFE